MAEKKREREFRKRFGFGVGSVVRLKRKFRARKGYGGTARISTLYSDINGGARLQSRLGGFWSWNGVDLEPASHTEERG